MELKGELQRAIQREELFLCYQPIVDLMSGRIRGFEALLRWHHPKRGILLPGDFVSLAEDTGLIVPISQWVFQTACEHTQVWRQSHPQAALSIAVNLSPRHLQQMDLIDEIAALLREHDIPAGNMVLELTENILMQDSEGTISKLRQLKDLGVKLAIDDFGTGFSSLGYLKRFPIDYLKIAKYFVDGLKAGATDSELVHAIIKLGKALGLQIVAEGIETDIQHERLRALGCHLGQGNRLARPLAIDEVDSLLALDSLEEGTFDRNKTFALAEQELN
jgi:EAL domain-containing protein (putative c-di-GMP-specific phosphodiesterase class I)